MVQFRHRIISAQQGVGHRLKVARRSLGLTLDDIAQALNIRRSLLIAVENGGFFDVSEPYYRELILKTYGEYLGVDCEALISDYRRESVYYSNEKKSKRLQPKLSRSALWAAPRMIRNVLVGGIIAGICAYVIFLAAAAIQPPRLVVMSPTNNIESSDHTIVVKGVADREADVSINGQQVLKQGDGTFDQSITLSQGVNMITVSAAKKYSKDTTVTRRVLYSDAAAAQAAF